MLDKLDVVTSMRSSGGRTKRIRLLRREINTLRQTMNQQQNFQSANGNNEEEEEEEEEKKGNKKDSEDNRHLPSASPTGTGKRIFTLHDNHLCNQPLFI